MPLTPLGEALLPLAPAPPPPALGAALPEVSYDVLPFSLRAVPDVPCGCCCCVPVVPAWQSSEVVAVRLVESHFPVAPMACDVPEAESPVVVVDPLVGIASDSSTIVSLLSVVLPEPVESGEEPVVVLTELA